MMVNDMKIRQLILYNGTYDSR